MTFLEEDALLPVTANFHGNSLDSGQYKYEFVFKLPLNIPGKSDAPIMQLSHIKICYSNLFHIHELNCPEIPFA